MNDPKIDKKALISTILLPPEKLNRPPTRSFENTASIGTQIRQVVIEEQKKSD